MLEQRKAALAKLLRKAKPGIRLSEHLTGPGQTIFEHACRLRLEGIVSKRVSSSYRSGKAKFSDGANRAGLLLCDGNAVTARIAVIFRFDASDNAKRPARIVAGAL